MTVSIFGMPWAQLPLDDVEAFLLARRGRFLPGVDPQHVASATRELHRARQIPAPEP